MKYMGSKAKVARYIVPIIQEQIERSGYETYLDDFVPVWIHSVTRTMNQNKTIAATEKLFVAKEVLEREEIVAAV